MKVAAFTLLEIIVALALMSIVVGVVISSVGMAGARAQLYSKDTQAYLKLTAFSINLEEDLARANSAIWNDSEGLKLSNYDNSEVSYRLENGYLIRQKEANRDSIAASSWNPKTLKSKNENDLQSLSELEVSASLFGAPISLYFFKEYHAQTNLLTR